MPMRTFLGFLCLTFSAASAIAQDNLRQLLPTDESLARHGLVRGWYAFAPVDGARESVQRVIVAGDQLQLQTNASRLHVLNAETGKLLWSAQMGPPLPGQFGSAINSNSVFAINGSYLYRLSREDGTRLWSIRLPQPPNTAPTADDERVIVPTREGRLYVFQVDTKDVLWFYQTNGAISLPAILLDDKIVCASQDGKVYVFQPSSRNPTVRPQPESPASAPLAAWGRLAIVASQDYKVYAVDVRTGDTVWRYSSGNEVRRPLTVIGNEVYVSPEDLGLHVLSAENGTHFWQHPRAQEFVCASKNRVYAADKYGQLLILDRATGRQLGVWDSHRFDFRVRNDINDRLFLVTKSGLVVCLHEKANTQPVVHERIQSPPPAGGEIKSNGTKAPAAN